MDRFSRQLSYKSSNDHNLAGHISLKIHLYVYLYQKRNYLLEDPSASEWTLLLDSRIQIPIGDRTSPLIPFGIEHTSCVLDLSYFKRWFYWTGERAFKSAEQKRRFDPTAMEFKVCINNADGLFARRNNSTCWKKNFSRKQSRDRNPVRQNICYIIRV